MRIEGLSEAIVAIEPRANSAMFAPTLSIGCPWTSQALLGLKVSLIICYDGRIKGRIITRQDRTGTGPSRFRDLISHLAAQLMKLRDELCRHEPYAHLAIRFDAINSEQD